MKLIKRALVFAIAPLLLLLLVPLTAACGGDDEPFTTVRAEVERDTSPSVSTNDITELTAGNTSFALDLHRLLAAESENVIFSPFSVSIALAMTYAGARGVTEQEMAAALHFTLPQDRLHPAFNMLDQDLTKRGKIKLDDENATAPELRIVNATWAAKDYSFLDSYLEALGRNYGAALRLLDFRNDPAGARKTINDWVDDETEGRIKDLIPAGAINPSTLLVLTNAIYFKGSWATKFDKELTAPGSFELLAGSKVDVEFMHAPGADARYARTDSLEAIELPYVGEEVSMVLLVPDRGKFITVETELNAESLGRVIDALAPASIKLALSKFEFEWQQSLIDPLKVLGMTSAFDNADFSGMDGTRNLVISDVVHKAYISVDEEGTEAAAATAVIVLGSSAQQSIEVSIDRPFIFLIRDNKTGALLFVGHVVNPTLQ